MRFERGYSLFELEVSKTQTRIVYAITVPLLMLSHLVFMSYLKVPLLPLPNAGVLVLLLFSIYWISLDISSGLLTTIYYLIWWGLLYVFVQNNKHAWHITLFIYITTWLLHIYVYIDYENGPFKFLYIIKAVTIYPLFITCQLGFTVDLLENTYSKIRRYRSFHYTDYSYLRT